MQTTCTFQFHCSTEILPISQHSKNENEKSTITQNHSIKRKPISQPTVLETFQNQPHLLFWTKGKRCTQLAPFYFIVWPRYSQSHNTAKMKMKMQKSTITQNHSIQTDDYSSATPAWKLTKPTASPPLNKEEDMQTTWTLQFHCSAETWPISQQSKNENKKINNQPKTFKSNNPYSIANTAWKLQNLTASPPLNREEEMHTT